MCRGKQLSFFPQIYNWGRTKWIGHKSGLHVAVEGTGSGSSMVGFLILNGHVQPLALLFPSGTHMWLGRFILPLLMSPAAEEVSLNLRCSCPSWVWFIWPSDMAQRCWDGVQGTRANPTPAEGLYRERRAAPGDFSTMKPSRYHRDEQSLPPCWTQVCSSRNKKKKLGWGLEC